MFDTLMRLTACARFDSQLFKIRFLVKSDLNIFIKDPHDSSPRREQPRIHLNNHSGAFSICHYKVATMCLSLGPKPNQINLAKGIEH